MESMLEQGMNIGKFFGDGSFDDTGLFRFLEDNRIEPAIKTRKNAVLSGEGTLRDREISERNRLGYKRWAKEKQYGRRWPGT